MSWSWKIGRVAGIPIYVHWTFLILLGWVLIEQFARQQSILLALTGVAFAIALFGCVVLHELGHALMARRFGVGTTDITLLPIGGLARLQRIPEKPSQELLVALAGPAVNVFIVAVLLLAGVRYPAGLNNPRQLVEPAFWSNLLLVNTLLVAFNLLPAFPMDGGRVFRALLAMRMDYARATRAAASVGQVLAIGFGLLGLQTMNPVLVLIATFVWIGAEAEASQVEERFVLRGVPVRAAMVTEYLTLSANDSLGQAADLMLAGTQHDFPVRGAEGSTAVLTRSNLIQGLSQGGRQARVGDYAQDGADPVEANSPLVAAVADLRASGLPCLQVVDRGAPVGWLTLENIGEFLMVRSALAAAPGPGRGGLAETTEFSRGSFRTNLG
ncbi:MAG: site-2 protease family protein [Isosphaeraceae bacterium]